MPLFIKDEKCVLFVHVPKTGGASIASYFRSRGWRVALFDDSNPWNSSTSNFYRKISDQHLHANPLRELVRLDRCDKIFMIVRNPEARIISEYRYQLASGAVFHDPRRTFSDWWREKSTQFRVDHSVDDNHIRPQTDFWLEGAEVFKIEDGLHQVAKLEEGLAPPPEENSSEYFPTVNVSEKTGLDIRLSPELRDEIRSFYKSDFSRFHYR